MTPTPMPYPSTSESQHVFSVFSWFSWLLLLITVETTELNITQNVLYCHICQHHYRHLRALEILEGPLLSADTGQAIGEKDGVLSTPWNSSPRSIAPYCFWIISTPEPTGQRTEEAAAVVTPLMRTTLLFQRAVTCLLSPPWADAGIRPHQPRRPAPRPCPLPPCADPRLHAGLVRSLCHGPSPGSSLSTQAAAEPSSLQCCRPFHPAPGTPCSARPTAGWEAGPSLWTNEGSSFY